MKKKHIEDRAVSQLTNQLSFAFQIEAFEVLGLFPRIITITVTSSINFLLSPSGTFINSSVLKPVKKKPRTQTSYAL